MDVKGILVCWIDGRDCEAFAGLVVVLRSLGLFVGGLYIANVVLRVLSVSRTGLSLSCLVPVNM